MRWPDLHASDWAVKTPKSINKLEKGHIGQRREQEFFKEGVRVAQITPVFLEQHSKKLSAWLFLLELTSLDQSYRNLLTKKAKSILADPEPVFLSCSRLANGSNQERYKN